MNSESREFQRASLNATRIDCHNLLSRWYSTLATIIVF